MQKNKENMLLGSAPKAGPANKAHAKASGGKKAAPKAGPAIKESGGKKMMHIALQEGQVGKYVFLPGSPQRAQLIARHFTNPVLLAKHREHFSYGGQLCGQQVCVTSTGIGGPSAGIALEELVQCGATTFLRIGTCASTSPQVHMGDVILPKGAVRMEETGLHYLPWEFPALPDYQVFKALVQAAKESGYPYNTGVSITKDSFYTEVSPKTKPVYPYLKQKWSAYEKGGATSTSMECSLLFLAAASLGVSMGSVMVCATNYKEYSNNAKHYPKNWEQRAIQVGIAAMCKIITGNLAAPTATGKGGA